MWVIVMNDGWSSRVLLNLKAFSRFLFGGRDLRNFTPLEGYIYIYILRIYIYTLCTSWIYVWLCFSVFFFCQLWVSFNVYNVFTFYKKLKRGTVGYCKAWKSHAEDGPSDDEVAERLWRRVEVKTSGDVLLVLDPGGPWIQLYTPLKSNGWNITGCWFQIFFIFYPICGRFPFWLIFFKFWVETTN